MYSKVMSAALKGIDAEKVFVEADVAMGFPVFSIVGLPDTGIRESRDRVRIAVQNSGIKFPDRRVTVNLSPADVRKEGSHFDLPIALAVLISAGICREEGTENTAFLGELNLEGGLNRITGALPLMLGLRDMGVKRMIVPEANHPEAELIQGTEIICSSSLQETVEIINGGRELEPVKFVPPGERQPQDLPDFSEVAGQENAERALQIGAAAMHNILMSGPPGSGKTMLASRALGLLPPMNYQETLEVSKIYSAYGGGDASETLIRRRPFRAPDHTISPASMIGGGNRVRAGEVSLAHMGILFLDELPEFSRDTLESLRRPVEDEECTIARLGGAVTLPSKFLLIGAMNPCPCGYYRSGRRPCTCTETAVRKYRSRISGPFIDRFDIFLEVQPVDIREINSGVRGKTTEELRRPVLTARAVQEERYAREQISCNSQMSTDHIKKYCTLDGKSRKLLDSAYEKYGMSARAYNRVLKVSRTIADMESRSLISYEDVAEALAYRLNGGFFGE